MDIENTRFSPCLCQQYDADVHISRKIKILIDDNYIIIIFLGRRNQIRQREERQQRRRQRRRQQQQQEQVVVQDIGFNLPNGEGFIQMKIRAAGPIFTEIISETRTGWEMFVPPDHSQQPILVNGTTGTATNSPTVTIGTAGSGIGSTSSSSPSTQVVVKQEQRFRHPFEAFCIDNL